MKRLPENDRWRAIGMLQVKETYYNVARYLNVSQPVIKRLWNRYQETGKVTDLPRKGRPRSTTADQDRKLVNKVMEDRHLTSTQLRHSFLAATGVSVSEQTVRNRLHAVNLRARRPHIVRPLSAHHREARKTWSQKHARWTAKQWDSVMFSDESIYTLNARDGRLRVWRRAGERHIPCTVIKEDLYARGRVQVWAGITTTGRTELHICHGSLTGLYYRDKMIREVVMPFAKRQGKDFIFQDDNAPAHRSRLVQDEWQGNNVRTLPWPAMSPDLSPIEPLWDMLRRQVRERRPPPENLQELADVLQEEWRRIPQEKIEGLIRSMRRRCLACLASDGASIHQ